VTDAAYLVPLPQSTLTPEVVYPELESVLSRYFCGEAGDLSTADAYIDEDAPARLALRVELVAAFMFGDALAVIRGNRNGIPAHVFAGDSEPEAQAFLRERVFRVLWPDGPAP
jgi:hypothetical protein